MKVALVILEGQEQIVLTPDTDLEKTLLEKLDRDTITVKRGSFYHCRGGWYRQGPGDDSTIILLGNRSEAA